MSTAKKSTKSTTKKRILPVLPTRTAKIKRISPVLPTKTAKKKTKKSSKKKRILPVLPMEQMKLKRIIPSPLTKKNKLLPILPKPSINCGIVYTIKNKKDTQPVGFMIGELHEFNFNCPASEFKYFFDYADLFFFEKSVKKDLESNNNRRRDLLTIPTNYGRYKYKGKKKYFLETRKQCHEYSRLIEIYNKNEMEEILKKEPEENDFEEMEDYSQEGQIEKEKILSSINNPIDPKYLTLIKYEDKKNEIQEIFKDGINRYDEISLFDIIGAVNYLYNSLGFIKMLYLNLGINEYFIEENKKDNIEFSKDTKPENTPNGILKKRNNLWMKKINKILQKPTNIKKKFVIVVGVEHLLLDGGEDGLVKLFEKEGKIVEKISTNETYSYFNQTNKFSFSNERPTEGNNNSYHNISF